MRSSFSQSIAATAVGLMLAVAGGAAVANPVGSPVTIQESAATGAAPHLFQADQLSGQYDEVLTATSPSTFVTEAIFNAGGWFLSASPVATQVNGFGANGYGIYAKFASSGSFSTTGGNTSFVGGSGRIEIYLDPNQDTNYDVKSSAIGDVNNLNLVSGAASVSDDQYLGFATVLTAGNGSANSGTLSNGNFELVFGDFTLVGAGFNYFTAPRPFYMVLDLNGNFQSFTPTSGSSTQLLNNSANAFFLPNAVPEPNMVALVGIALFGMALGARRNRKS